MWPVSETLFGGDVYSSADPFATAITYDDDTVVWVGSDEAVSSGTPLDGDFVAPGFVDAAVDLRNTDGYDYFACGVTSIHVIGTSEQCEAVSGPHVVAYPTDAREGRRAVRVEDVREASDVTDPVFVCVDSAAELAELEGLVRDSEWKTAAQRAGLRGMVGCDTDVDPEVWGGSGLAVTVNPHHTRDLHALFNAGAQVSFSLAGNSWGAVRAGVENGLSARAAFNASTRFGFRALGQFEGGVLAPGSTVDMVRWSATSLVVQVADPRVAAWSTDPRSGTPGLPDLNEAFPHVRTIWVGGRSYDVPSESV